MWLEKPAVSVHWVNTQHRCYKLDNTIRVTGKVHKDVTWVSFWWHCNMCSKHAHFISVMLRGGRLLICRRSFRSHHGDLAAWKINTCFTDKRIHLNSDDVWSHVCPFSVTTYTDLRAQYCLYVCDTKHCITLQKYSCGLLWNNNQTVEKALTLQQATPTLNHFKMPNVSRACTF